MATIPLWLILLAFGGAMTVFFLAGLWVGRRGQRSAETDSAARRGDLGDRSTDPLPFTASATAPSEPQSQPSEADEPDEPVHRRPPATTRAAAAAMVGAGPSGTRPVVLLIDDRVELLAMHAAYLHKHGYGTLLAGDGRSGLAMAREHRPQLIVLDHSMPDLSGVQVARELKADPDTAHIPILYMTAHSYGAVGAAAIAAGCAVFLPKPVDPSRLLREIESRAPLH